MTDASLDDGPSFAGRAAGAPAADAGPMLAADGTPLKRSLTRALRRQKLRSLMLIAPLLLFVLVTFIAPIADMLFRSVENQLVPDTLPRTVRALQAWDPDSDATPGEDTFAALYTDLVLAAEYKVHTRVGSRLNYENSGISSLFRKSGRDVGRFDTDIYTDQFEALDPAWGDPAVWATLMQDDAARDALPQTASAYDAWAKFLTDEEGDDPAAEQPWDFIFAALYRDLAAQPPLDGLGVPADALLPQAAAAVPGFETVSLKASFLDSDKDWDNLGVWRTIRAFSGPYTAGYFLNSVDAELTSDGVQLKPESERIYLLLFVRTLWMSLVICGVCLLLGYPIAYLLSTLPTSRSNLLLILVLLPFWTSLLVRTSAWKILLQQQGVINDVLVWLGIISDSGRLVMINNQLGTIIAMTHILLPFMILPLYSVMKTIPVTYVRAAKSLGATPFTAFWRVYFPQSIPGIGAGSILVFILAIGYYITPELVGGTQGVFISNRIAFHISTSLNWGLAAALGSILLAVVMLLYWTYDRIVGIDNVKLG